MKKPMPAKKQPQVQKVKKFPLWTAVLTILLVALAAAMVWAFTSLGGTPNAAVLDAPAAAAALPDEISASEAAQKRDAGALILDVREPDEWNEYHIPGATLIPLNDLSSRLNSLPTDQEIVVVCRSGNRSATGRDILRSAGFSQVTSMAGGMKDWASKGFPTATGP